MKTGNDIHPPSAPGAVLTVTAMKRTFIFILILSMLLLLCSGCSSAKKEETTLSLRIVDGAGTGSMILAGDQVYLLQTEGLSVTVGQEEGRLEDLQNGMMVDVTCSGVIADSVPAQISGAAGLSIPSVRSGMSRNPGGAFYDLCTLYLSVLENLWYREPELNDDVEYISVDLSEAPGSLTAAEKSAIAWAFAIRHKAVPLELSINELMDTGYIHLTDLRWNDGVLFTIGSGPSASTVGTVSFSASKWRSGSGTVQWNSCIADAPGEGAWTNFTIGAER